MSSSHHITHGTLTDKTLYTVYTMALCNTHTVRCYRPPKLEIELRMTDLDFLALPTPTLTGVCGGRLKIWKHIATILSIWTRCVGLGLEIDMCACTG